MTIDAIRELAVHMVNTELEGDRTTLHYRQEVKKNIEQFFLWLEAKNLNKIKMIGKAELMAYYLDVCSQRVRTGTRISGGLLSKRTINGRILAVRKTFTALYRAGYVNEDPFHGFSLDMPPDRSSKRLPFTEAEMETFLEQINSSTSLGLRNRTLFELIYSSGLRVGEAARLTIGDLDLERREILVHGKGSRDRIVPISLMARDYLQWYAGERLAKLEEPVFKGTRGKGAGKAMRPQDISRRFRTLLIAFGMDGPGRSTHAVRHSTATHLLDHGANIRHIQELLGHKSIENTARYAQVHTAGLQKVYRKYHPGEHELFEIVDEAYEQRLETLIAGTKEIVVLS